MDTAAILDQCTQDVSNLPAELLHILTELGTRDATMYEAKKKLNAKDATIHKFIRQNGSMTKFPKEAQLYPKIIEEFEQLEQLQNEKVVLANTALFLTAKHLMKLEADIEKLKSEGLLALEDNEEFDLDTEVLSSKPSSRLGSVGAPNLNNMFGADSPSSSGSSAVDSSKKHTKKASAVKLNTHTPSASISRTTKRQKTDELKTPEPDAVVKKIGGSREKTPQDATKVEYNEAKEDEEVFCFCGGPSYGSMVGCDGEDCKYEWFHYSCVGITEQPSGNWFCSDCLAKKQSERDDKKKQKKKKKDK